MRRELAACILIGCAGGVGAADSGPPQTPVESDDRDSVLVGSRKALRGLTEKVAAEVDSWFGDKPFREGGRVSGSIGFKALFRQGDSPDTSLRFQAQVNLPNLNDKGYLFFGRDNERELVTDQPDTFTRRELLLNEKPRTEQTAFGGIGYRLLDLFDLRAGVRRAYKPYVQARYRKVFGLTEHDALDFRETLFWNTDDGVGATTALNYTHAYTPTLALRWQNAGTISEDSDGTEWFSSLGLFKSLSEMRTVSFEGIVRGETAGPDDIKEYGVRLTWEQPIYRDWTFVQVSLGHFWPRGEADSGRSRQWSMGLGVELRF